ncbi:hypothetical protein [Paenibacillus sp. SN-8-1]|uniref:hypothetical protein n=1 Tax=Paenibacillus sp. SN-8-1 TaxID=3435409 RepID=UPI003D9A32F0
MPGIEGDIWIAAAGDNKNGTGIFGLWHSVDSGSTFKRLDQVQEAATIGFGKAAPGKKNMALYSYARLGGKFGIYRSDDYGQSWVRINDDQHQFGAANVTITGDPRVYGRVYVGTNGLGIVIGNPAGKPADADKKAPKIEMISKSNPVRSETYVLTGKVNEDLENDAVTVHLNGGEPEQVQVVNGMFTKSFTLVEGNNIFEIEAKDLAGNRSMKRVTVKYKLPKK